MRTNILLTPTLLSAALAAPSRPAKRAPLTAQAVVEAIMPTSTSCDKAQFPAECRTAAQASPFFVKAYAKHECYSPAQIGALLAWVGLESADMKYKHNISPGRPGQGTSNMMMPKFVKEYATDLLGADKLAGLDDIGVLALVMADEYNFGSAAWFMTKHCADAKALLATDAQAGWTSFLGCIGVSSTPEREAYWTRAKKVLTL